MAKFSRGITYAEHDFISAAKLHALIDTAIAAGDGFPGTPTLYDIIMSDLASGVRGFHTVDSPSPLVNHDLKVASDGTLDLNTGGVFDKLTTDIIFFTNNSVTFTLVTGTPVVVDTSNATNCHIWTGVGSCPEPLGVAVTVAGPGSSVGVQLQGICPVRIINNGTVAVESFLSVGSQGATLLTPTNSLNSDVLAICIAAEFGSGVALGLLTR